MGRIFDGSLTRGPATRDELLKVIRSVRRRWRTRVAIRGAAIVVGAGLAVVLLSAYGVDHFRFSPTAITVFRVVAWAGVAALALRFLVLPLSRRISDERVALYIEEHEPSLQAHLLSAVDYADQRDDDEQPGISAALTRRMLETAVQRCAEIDYGRRVERRALARSSGTLAAVSLVAALALLLAPPVIRESGRVLLFPSSGGEAANPYSIEVTPGHASVARGGDLKVAARLRNFDAERVQIAARRGGDGAWERHEMGLDEETGEYVLFLFDLAEETEYFVEASGVRSSLYRVTVEDMPYTQRVDLEYHFPAYTGLNPQRHEDAGDIAALRGTEVILEVTPTVGVEAGALVLEHGDTVPLTVRDDGRLTGRLTVREDGFYRVVFQAPLGGLVDGSPDYTIDVLVDQPPTISFARPGRDVRATRVDEVFTEVEAQDDYGLGGLELVYRVNGGPEETVGLYGGGTRTRELTAAHTFFLEELDLRPGDFISYYATVRDNDGVDGPHERTTDIYFVEVRPFDREYRQAPSAGGGGAGENAFNAALAERQREIIAATFKVVRDREDFEQREYRENLATLTLAQGRLREDVEALVRRLRTRGVAQMDSAFKTIAEALPKAAEAMSAAEGLLGERKPEDALGPEQVALQHLQRAEAAFRETRISQGQGGGRGGGNAADAEDLADLFELELDKMRNQYERVQRDQQRATENEVDETLQKLKELARRQQQENERARARAESRGAGSGGAGGQRRLAEEAEEVARRLERLARESSNPELQEAARRLRDAADAMRRAAAGSRTGESGNGRSALDELNEARRRLEESRTEQFERDVQNAVERARRLADEQDEITEDVEGLRGMDPARRSERVRRLQERKEEMSREVADLEAELDRLGRESRREQPEASRKLEEAANSIRAGKLKEKIRYSRSVVAGRSPEYARNFEEEIGANIEELREDVEEALRSAGESEADRLAQAAERTRDLVRDLESLQERLRERAEGTRDDRAEQQGEPEAGGGQGEGEGRAGASRDGEGREAVDGGEPPAGGRGQAGGEARPRGFGPDEQRQLRRELRERREAIEDLEDALREEGLESAELERVAEGLRELQRQTDFGDPRGLVELQRQVVQGLKEFEYALRRQIEGEDRRDLLLSGSDEVPDGYRELVERYYKALAGQEDR